MTADRPRVAVVDDHALLVGSLSVALAAEGLDVVAIAPQAPDLLVRRIVDAVPQLVLLDLELGGDAGDGTVLVPRLVAAGARVLVVTAVVDRVRVAAAVAAGAAGYVHKSRAFDGLVDIVLRAARGEPVLPDNERQDLLTLLRRHRHDEERRLAPFQRLTPRERQVLAALGDGMSVDAMSRAWVVSVATVRTQVRGVLTKLGAPSQLAAVAMARRQGWLPADDGGPAGPAPACPPSGW